MGIITQMWPLLTPWVDNLCPIPLLTDLAMGLFFIIQKKWSINVDAFDRSDLLRDMKYFQKIVFSRFKLSE